MLKSIDNCQICGSSVAKILLTKNIFLGGKKRESTWVECLECGTAHIVGPANLLKPA